MSINAEWTNADALGFKPYTAYESASVTYSTTTESLTATDIGELLPCPFCGGDAELRELAQELYHELDAATQYDAGGGRGVMSEFAGRMRELGVDA